MCRYKSPAAKAVDVADDRAFPLGSYSKEGEQKGGGEARSGSFDQNPKCTPSKLHCAFDVDEDAPLNIFLAKETLLLACGIYGVGSSRRKIKIKRKRKRKEDDEGDISTKKLYVLYIKSKDGAGLTRFWFRCKQESSYHANAYQGGCQPL